MPQTRAQIWGTLKRYLAYTAAGFVVLGGVGAIEAARPPMVTPASASQTLRNSASAQALLGNGLGDSPGWMQRLRFDLTASEVASDSGDRQATVTAAPYYPAPDTSWAKDQAPDTAPSAGISALDIPALKAAPTASSATQTAIVQVAAAQPAQIAVAAAKREPASVDLAANPPKPSASVAAQPASKPVAGRATLSLVAALNWVYGDTDKATSLYTAEPAAEAAESDQAALLPIPQAAGPQATGPASDDQTADEASNAATDSVAGIEGEQRVIEVRRGDTLFGLLTKAGLTEAEAEAAGHSLADVFTPSDLKIGQEITLNFATGAGPSDSDTSAKLVGLKLTPSVERDVKVTRASDGQFVAASIDRPLTERIDRTAGEIDGSLFESAHDAGLPASLIGEIIKAFSYDVDFQRDIHEGDSFEALYERFDSDTGDLAKVGHLLYASLTLAGKPMAIYYFEHGGFGEYYNGDGQAVRKSLLKTPVDGARITSTFGMRVNPILGYSMMHKGIDFGAPTGTPIFAAGNGTIEYIGEKNGYGNYIKMRHNSTFETAYGHISRFASGMRRGSKVKQGQVIAYVGATGRATGPHLHYEIIINGAQVNPASVKTASADKLTGKDLAAFKVKVASIEAERRKTIQRNEIDDRSGDATIDCTGQHGCTN